MSNVTHGADPVELRSLGDKLTAQVEAIEAVLGVGSQVESTNWVGPARDSFVTQWNEGFRVSLQNLATTFASAGTECANRASSLEAAMGGGVPA